MDRTSPIVHFGIAVENITKKITIRGAVQGVGFRPFVYRAAQAHGIAGTVCNDGQGVEITAWGTTENMARFETSLRQDAPPLSAIRSYESMTLSKTPALEGFRILETEQTNVSHAEAARDTAVCDDCIAEMRDPSNRRFRHAFINCTNCGPRYTLIQKLPYDRPATTMATFAMCPDCREEYENPLDRRFHAQPVCCPNCGPQLRFCDSHGTRIESGDPIRNCVEMLSQGGIVAIKGIGGFHLACRADSAQAVKELRIRKRREEKPFAIMVKNAQTAKAFADLKAEEIRLLESPERPIVLVKKRAGAIPLPEEIAPHVASYGLFLPYAPLHHLLFDEAPYSALVMTSANRTEEPIIHQNEDAVANLADIADFFLLHNRDILLRNDDSISRVVGGAPQLLRRARGFVPEPLPAGVDVNGIVATGGILKSTVTVGRADRCFVSQYLGNLESLEVLDNFESVLSHLLSLLQVKPEVFAADMHPSSLGRKVAEDSGLPVEFIQHHHAHAAACLAENGVDEPALAIVYDGTGYGSDGTIWGGEFLLMEGAEFRRAGHWAPMPMPGGDSAVMNPGRMALGALHSELGKQIVDRCSWLPDSEAKAVLALLAGPCPITSSVGRLFDSLAAMLGLCNTRSYEGQPAMLLEGIADSKEMQAYPCPIEEVNGILVLRGPALLVRALAEIEQHEKPSAIAARFQNAVARTSAIAAVRLLQAHGLTRVCLSGGCFQNVELTENLASILRGQGITVYTHRMISPNDEGISYGQVVIAAKRRQNRRREQIVTESFACKGALHAR